MRNRLDGNCSPLCDGLTRAAGVEEVVGLIQARDAARDTRFARPGQPEAAGASELLAQNKALIGQIELVERSEQDPARADRRARGQAQAPRRRRRPTRRCRRPRARRPTRPRTPARRRSARAGPASRARSCPNPDATRDIYAERCACGARCRRPTSPHAFAYDHIDLPPIKPVTTRVNLHSANCPCCGRRVAAKPPADMPPGSPFGPGIVAMVDLPARLPHGQLLAA